MKLFLDVDGVLLGGDTMRLANHAIEFLDFATSTFPTYWLTTHCLDGDATAVRDYLLAHTAMPDRDRVRDLIQRVQPTTWTTLKIEALPADGAFRWLDDSPLATELTWLRERRWLDRWLHVDTRAEPDDLLRATRLLRQLRA